MPERGNWAEIKDKRMGEPGAREAYNAARIAYELGRTVRQLRDQRCWSQTELARAAGMTQSAVACFEAGGTVPASLPVLPLQLVGPNTTAAGWRDHGLAPGAAISLGSESCRYL